MGTAFSEVIDDAYNKMTEYKFYDLPKNVSDMVLKSYLRSALVKYATKTAVTIGADYDLEMFDKNLTDDEIEIISSYLCLRYIDANYIRTTAEMKPFLTGTDFHAYNNDDVMKQVLEAQQRFETDTNSAAVIRTYRDKNSRFWNFRKRGR